MQEPGAKLWVGYPPKLVLLGLILVVEKLLLLHLPPASLVQWVHWFGGAPVLFFLTLLFFSRNKPALNELQKFPVSFGFLSVHLASLLSLAALQRYFFVSHFRPDSPQLHPLSNLWMALMLIAVLSLVAALIPPRKVWDIARGLGMAWVYASICTLAILILRHFASLSWNATSSPISQFLLQSCFHQTETFLKWFSPAIFSDPERHILGTPRFLIDVSWLCSGIEGLALVAVLIVIWLIYARRELRMERAVLIAPLALAFTWCLNIVRLAALIAIGNAGYGRVASNGFHAQAGWITLNLVALGFLLIIQNVRWFRKPPRLEAETETNIVSQPKVQQPAAEAQNFTAVYLLPFAVISAASMVSQAVSSGFEWFYPLRFVAALGAFWVFRKQYRAMDWRFGIIGPLAGLAVAAMWLVLRLAMAQTATGDYITAIGLEGLPAMQRIGWITIRVLAAVITVPIAEELAFRGFLARRVMNPEFQNVPYAALSPVALLVSAAAFGAMHGRMWAAGAVAGLLFGLVARLRGRIGEAVAAHAVANLAIAVLAVIRSDYSMC